MMGFYVDRSFGKSSYLQATDHFKDFTNHRSNQMLNWIYFLWDLRTCEWFSPYRRRIQQYGWHHSTHEQSPTVHRPSDIRQYFFKCHKVMNYFWTGIYQVHLKLNLKSIITLQIFSSQLQSDRCPFGHLGHDSIAKFKPAKIRASLRTGNTRIFFYNALNCSIVSWYSCWDNILAGSIVRLP